MKFLILAICLLIMGIAAYAQKADDTLATANGVTFTAGSLSDEVRKLYLNQDAAVAAERTALLKMLVRETLLETEAKARNVSVEEIVAAEIKKAPAPTDAEIKTVYDANRAALGGRTLEETRPQIVSFLRGTAEQKAVADLVEALKTKHKFSAGKDVHATDLKPTEPVFSIDVKTVTAAEFNSKFNANIYDIRAEIANYVLFDLENTIFSTLITQEAKAKNIEPGDVIASEITNKLRDFTEEERSKLESDLKKRLYAKYAVKIVYTPPAPVAHAVSSDDDPVSGNPAAPVTVVMFSDFQCSACAATHPVLKKVVSGYGDKVKLVVRDFPLESTHPNAFRAALAANAARNQGKYFEFIEILYRNQDSLDAASLNRFAGELGLNLKQFELDLNSEKTAAEVRKDMADGVKHGARGTPTIFVNGVKIQRLSADAFRSAIDRALTAGALK